MLAQIKPLTQEERQLARSAAQEAVHREIGDRPNHDYFNICDSTPRHRVGDVWCRGVV